MKMCERMKESKGVTEGEKEAMIVDHRTTTIKPRNDCHEREREKNSFRTFCGRVR